MNVRVSPAAHGRANGSWRREPGRGDGDCMDRTEPAGGNGLQLPHLGQHGEAIHDLLLGFDRLGLELVHADMVSPKPATSTCAREKVPSNHAHLHRCIRQSPRT